MFFQICSDIYSDNFNIINAKIKYNIYDYGTHLLWLRL